MLKYLLFDVDETLYPHDSPVWPSLRGRIIQYMIERLHMTPNEAQTLRERYLKEYGTTTRGLYLNDGIDIEDYLEYVHAVPLDSILPADRALDEALTRIPLEKCLFTNASRQHGRNVTAALGIAHHFTHIFALEDFDYICKPDPHPYAVVLKRLGATGDECMLLEDSVANLLTAKQFGMTTVLVDGRADDAAQFDFTIARVHEIVDVLAKVADAYTGTRVDE
ncbi:MAG: pyrimidine 5'-nucleotidase [Chloroflexota bacterium]